MATETSGENDNLYQIANLVTLTDESQSNEVQPNFQDFLDKHISRLENRIQTNSNNSGLNLRMTPDTSS